MLKKLFTLLILCLVAIPVALSLSQDNPVRLEITGIDATALPTVVITASVTNALGQPILDLTQDNFAVSVEGIDGVVPDSTIVSVENVSSDNIPFSVVLMIDVSTSMDGTPLDEAKEAARVFVNTVSENDSVAVMTFGSTTTLVQDFTTDKAVLISAIDSLQAGGVTALYQGSYEAVQQALNAPTSRRVVIILSDGAEYGDASTAGSTDALQQAIINGVPVYTIGIGFGTDRSYLDALSSGTNANFYESPAEDQLVQIYGDLASLLRSQYIITLTLAIPSDGQTYTVHLEVNTDEGDANATGVLRAPIPVPIVEVPEAGDPLSELTTLQFTVYADDPLTNITLSQGEVTLLSDDDPEGDNGEYTFTVEVDPTLLEPTGYTIDAQATDEDGDVGSGSYSYEVAALPSVITITGLPAEGEELNQPADVSVVVLYSQTPVTNTDVTVSGAPVDTTGDATSQTFTLDPYALQAGENIVTITTTNSSGTITTTEDTFTVATLPPVMVVNGLGNGDEVTTTIQLSPSFVSQAPIASVSWFLDGSELAQQFSEPFGVEINPLTLSGGEHTLNVTATDANGTSATISVTFTVPASVALTATALAPTATLIPTETPTPSPTPNLAQTQSARDTAAAQFAADAQATSDALGTATVSAQETANAESAAQSTNAQATLNAANDQAISDAQGTLGAQQAAEMQTSQADTLATVNAAIAQSTVNAEQAQMTANAQATLDAIDAQATNQAGLTATSIAQMSVAQQTEFAATQNASIAQATANAQGTQDAINARTTATAQAVANVQATRNAESTANAQGTQDILNTQGTANAQETQVRGDQLTGTAIIQSARETAQAAATGTGVAVADAASDQATQTAIAGQTQTAEVTTTRVPQASLTPTGELTEVDAQGAPDTSAINTALIAGCGIGLVLLVIIFFVLNRRRTRSKS